MKTFTWQILLSVVLSVLLTTVAYAQRLATGGRHTLSIHADGSLWAWGANSYGQLGLGDVAPRNRPVQVGTGTRWQSVSAGAYFSLGLQTDGTLWAWGNNSNGQLGLGPTAQQNIAQQNAPQLVSPGSTWVSVSAGDYFAVGLKSDGTLWAWGLNLSGQLGLGTTTQQTSPQRVGTSTWLAADAGATHTLAIRQDGTLWAWGNNANGQLGTGTTATAAQSTPAQVGTGTNWRSASGGSVHSLALQVDGSLWAWGANSSGQLGLGTTTQQTSPQRVGIGTNWRSISAGYLHSAALSTDNSLWLWGMNNYGQVGDGTTSMQPAPVQVLAGANWQAVSTGQYFTVAGRADGSVWAWGYGSYGQLGNGMGTQFYPYRLEIPTQWRSVSAGSYHTLGIRQDGTLWAWGGNIFGQLGLGTTTDQRLPAQVGTSTTWASVSSGYYHTAAVRQDGTLWTWGDNSSGALGDGTTISRSVPAQVGTATNWISVSAGTYYTLALKTDGTLWAWGRNTNGQLGLGTTTQQNAPLQVGTASWQIITTSRSSTSSAVSLAIRADGTLWAWGNNLYGQLGQGTFTGQQSAPVQVGTDTWQSVAAGNQHALGVKADGTLWAWGYNTYGQLGIGYPFTTTTITKSSPTQVGTSNAWTSVAAGFTHSAALRYQVTLYTWGGNTDGTLGDGTTTDQDEPELMAGSNNGFIWKAVSTGFFHTVALQANPDGTLWTWGSNSNYQLTLPNAVLLPATAPDGGGSPLAAATAATAATWTLAPNPAHSLVQLTGLPAGPVQVCVFNAQGQQVASSTSSNLSTEGLAPGLYLVRAAAANHPARVLRLVVQ